MQTTAAASLQWIQVDAQSLSSLASLITNNPQAISALQQIIAQRASLQTTPAVEFQSAPVVSKHNAGTQPAPVAEPSQAPSTATLLQAVKPSYVTEQQTASGVQAQPANAYANQSKVQMDIQTLISLLSQISLNPQTISVPTPSAPTVQPTSPAPSAPETEQTPAAVKLANPRKDAIERTLNSGLPKRTEEEESTASPIVQGLVLPSVQTPQVFAESSMQGVFAIANESAAATARTNSLVEVVDAVCDQLMVTPGVLRGEGTVRIQLKPDVLDGAEISLEAKGRNLNIVFFNVTYDAQQVLERNMAQLEQHLAGRIHNYQIAVAVKKGKENERI